MSLLKFNQLEKEIEYIQSGLEEMNNEFQITNTSSNTNDDSSEEIEEFKEIEDKISSIEAEQMKESNKETRRKTQNILEIERKKLVQERKKLVLLKNMLTIHEENKTESESTDKIIAKRIKRQQSAINIIKQRLKVVIELRNIGWKFYIMALIGFLGATLAIVIQDNLSVILNYIEGLKTVAKLIYSLSILLIAEGNSIVKSSMNNKSLNTLIEKKNLKWINILTLPSWTAFYFVLTSIIFLFYPSFLEETLKNSIGFVALAMYSSLLISSVFLQLYDFVKLSIETFNDMIKDPKDRILALIATAGTVISLIALFR